MDEEQVDSISTSSNAARKKQLEKYLKHKSYEDYISVLNNMLADPKAKALLEEGFGGSLGDLQLDFSVKKLVAKSLQPTQSEIDVDKSLKYSIVKYPHCIDDIFNNSNSGVEIITPIITFRENFVIDGHHRWSQIYAVNPDAKIVCVNYNGPISWRQMLKATQGAIAAVYAERGEGVLPQSNVNGQNIFDTAWDIDALKKYIDETMVDEATNKFLKYLKCDTREQVIEYLANNILDLKYNNYPEKGSPNRGDMPQTNKASLDKDNKDAYKANDNGSALNKLKTGKILKGAIV